MGRGLHAFFRKNKRECRVSNLRQGTMGCGSCEGPHAKEPRGAALGEARGRGGTSLHPARASRGPHHGCAVCKPHSPLDCRAERFAPPPGGWQGTGDSYVPQPPTPLQEARVGPVGGRGRGPPACLRHRTPEAGVGPLGDRGHPRTPDAQRGRPQRRPARSQPGSGPPAVPGPPPPGGALPGARPACSRTLQPASPLPLRLVAFRGDGSSPSGCVRGPERQQTHMACLTGPHSCVGMDPPQTDAYCIHFLVRLLLRSNLFIAVSLTPRSTGPLKFPAAPRSPYMPF